MLALMLISLAILYMNMDDSFNMDLTLGTDFVFRKDLAALFTIILFHFIPSFIFVLLQSMPFVRSCSPEQRPIFTVLHIYFTIFTV